MKTYPGAAPPSPWGSNSAHTGDTVFTYSGKTTTTKDAAAKTRSSSVDGLGRLASVTENGSVTTSYGYDALDNLVMVTQSGQTRSFSYTSLSRLSTALNPESGTTYYYYDNNGNLARKVDARDVTVCFGVWNGSSCNAAVETGYDQLNRVLRKQYSATTPETPGVTYTYDCATNGKGLPCGVANSESASNIGDRRRGMTVVVLAFALFFVRFVAAEASYQRAQRVGSGYRFPVGMGLRITFRLGGPFLVVVGFKMAQQASGLFDWSTAGLVALLGLACLLAEPGEITATASGVTQKTLLGFRSKHISWEGAASRFVPTLRELLIIGHDGTAITHSQYHVGQSQLMFQLEKHGVRVQQ